MADDPTPTPTPTPSPTPSPTPAPDLKAIADSLIKTHGDANGAILELVRQTHSLREKNRDVSAKLPKDGDLVLSGEDVVRWKKYQELGQPADVRKALDTGQQAEATAKGLLREKTTTAAAKLYGYDSGVLGTLAKDLEIEIKDLTDAKGNPVGLDKKPLPKDGKVVQQAFVKDGDESVALDDYAARNWPSFMPALKPVAEKARPLGPPAGNNPGGPPPGERPTYKAVRSL